MITYYFIKAIIVVASLLIVVMVIFTPWWVCYETFYKKDNDMNPIVAMICAFLCLMQVLAGLDWMIFGYVKECC